MLKKRSWQSIGCSKAKLKTHWSEFFFEIMGRSEVCLLNQNTVRYYCWTIIFCELIHFIMNDWFKFVFNRWKHYFLSLLKYRDSVLLQCSVSTYMLQWRMRIHSSVINIMHFLRKIILLIFCIMHYMK